MKKFLLSLTLLTAVLIGQAQVVLNEVYSNPNTGNHEFFELYNTDISTTPIQLDCYTLVVYFREANGNNRRGFYVIDLPQSTIASKDYYVGASANSINVQGVPNVQAKFNWNNPGTTGYLKKFRQNNAGTGYSEVTSTEITANFNNIFEPIHSGGDVAVFLFNNGVYINGFAAGFNTGTTLPGQIASMPSLTVPYANSTCGTSFTIDWSTDIKKVEFQQGGGAGGTDNGFARRFDGNCGSWVKTSNSPNHTPGKPNGSATNTQLGFLKTSETIICGNRIDFLITETTETTAFPVTVQLYEDNDKIGVLDGNDVFITSQIVNSVSTTTYSFTSLDPAKSYIVVYKTSLGCLDKVEVPTVAGNLTTTEKYICGSQVDFTITGPSVLSPSAFPIEVEVYLDIDGDGSPDKDTAGAIIGDGNLLAEKTITSFSSLRQILEIPDGYKNQKLVIVYNSALSCLKLSKVPQEPVITLTTTPKNFCGNKVEFTITGASADATTYAFPMKAQLFYDGDNDGELDEPYGDPVDVLGTGPTVYSLSIAPADANKVFRVQYSSNTFACINEQKATVAGTLSFTTAQFGVCTNSTTYTVNYNVTGGSGDLTSAYPFKAYLYADDGDGKFDADDALLQTSDDITSVGGNEKYFFKVPGDKSVFIVYRNATGCFEQVSGLIEAPEASSCSVLPVTYQSFTAKRSNSSQVVLEWETATEAANKGFHIQRNIDGTWKEAGFVFSQATGGNSNTVLKYTFRDVNASKGISQYRILQVDATGKGQYSEIRAVRGDGALARMMVFPNPSTTGSVSLLFEDGASVRNIIINDVSGRAIRQYKGISHSSLTVDQLQSGFYTVVVTNQTTGITTTEKIIIKKR